MKYLTLITAATALLIVATVSAGNSATTAEGALRALKKQQYRYDKGISPADFIYAFTDVEYEVNEYLTTSAAKNSTLRNAISAAFMHQKHAKRACELFSMPPLPPERGMASYSLDSSWDSKYPGIRKTLSEGGIMNDKDKNWFLRADLLQFLMRNAAASIAEAEHLSRKKSRP